MDKEQVIFNQLKGELKHYCPDWDYLAIDEFAPEFEACTCFPTGQRRITMQVRLISVSAPVIDEVPDAQSLIAYFARVSSTANQLNHDTGPKLVASLVRRKEWSPLDMVDAAFEVVTTRDIARQMLRHVSFKFQEFSQRYAEVADAPVLREARLQHPTDRQMSVETDDKDVQDLWIDIQNVVAETAEQGYRHALAMGIAKEVARAVLPEGMTTSRLYMKGSIRSWIHYCGLRCDMKTQKEHRLVAQQINELLLKQFPILSEVLSEGQ